MQSLASCLVLAGCLAVQASAASLLARGSSNANLLGREAQNRTDSLDPPPASGEAQLWDSGAGLSCVGWRKTLTCVPSGPRDPLQDKDCQTIVGSEESGFCECEGYVHTAAVPCGHDPVNCTKECGVLQKLHREVFGAGFGDDADGPGGGPGGAKGDGAMAHAAASKDPYAAALKYGNQAVANVNNAVTNSNTLLSSAREMIGKMMNLKPWAQITKLGKDAEEAGKKTQELAKLARPFIYEQVNATGSLRRHAPA